jgi:5-methylcytosine-specific restriction endonuclease McrA
LAGRRKTYDEKIQSWLEWYDKNQQRSEYRRARYLAMTEAERDRLRELKKKSYQKRIAEGWFKPYRRLRNDDHVARELVISLLIERDGNKCGICGKEVATGEDSIDHVVPRNMGGPNTARNIRLAHRTCNNRRPRMPKELRLAMSPDTALPN